MWQSGKTSHMPLRLKYGIWSKQSSSACHCNLHITNIYIYNPDARGIIFFCVYVFFTFMVEDSLHLHAAPRVSDAKRGTGYNTLKGGRAVSGAH